MKLKRSSRLQRLRRMIADGVDLSLIRWTLSFTPQQRLESLEEGIGDVAQIRKLNAGR